MSESNFARCKTDIATAFSSVDSAVYDRPVAVWGAGNTTALYQAGMMRHSGKNDDGEGGLCPDFYIDMNAPKGGGVIYGKPFYRPDEVDMKMAKDYVILSSSAVPRTNKAILKSIEEMGLLGLSSDAYVLSKNQDKIFKVLSLLGDDVSREVYADVVSSRVQAQAVSGEHCCLLPTHFCLPEFCVCDVNTVMADVGAFVGDTLEDFLHSNVGMFKNIYLFEPWPSSYEALCKRIARLNAEWGFEAGKIVPLEMAISKASSTASMHSRDTSIGACMTMDALCAEQGGESIAVTSIDEYFRAIHVTHIKADIESVEYDMLLGAQTVISRDRPLLSICIYHSAYDLFDIPLLIDSMNMDYRMRVRHHKLPSYDTVLYCD